MCYFFFLNRDFTLCWESCMYEIARASEQMYLLSNRMVVFGRGEPTALRHVKLQAVRNAKAAHILDHLRNCSFIHQLPQYVVFSWTFNTLCNMWKMWNKVQDEASSMTWQVAPVCPSCWLVTWVFFSGPSIPCSVSSVYVHSPAGMVYPYSIR